MRPLNKKIDINTDENFEAIEVPIIIKSSQQLYFRLVSLFSGLFFLMLVLSMFRSWIWPSTQLQVF